MTGIGSHTTQSSDEELAKILARQSAGVETAMKAFETAEQIYLGAVAATSHSETITVSASTNPGNQSSEAR